MGDALTKNCQHSKPIDKLMTAEALQILCHLSLKQKRQIKSKEKQCSTLQFQNCNLGLGLITESFIDQKTLFQKAKTQVITSGDTTGHRAIEQRVGYINFKKKKNKHKQKQIGAQRSISSDLQCNSLQLAQLQLTYNQVIQNTIP